jgi:hypothetical protein
MQRHLIQTLARQQCATILYVLRMLENFRNVAETNLTKSECILMVAASTIFLVSLNQ